MRKATKYIGILNEESLCALEEVYRNHPTHRVRQRAHAILLSSRKYTIGEISRVLEVERHTVSLWLEKYKEHGVGGLEEGERSGRPRKVTQAHEALIKELVVCSPQSVVTSMSVIVGRLLSSSTIRRTLRSLGYVWKRHRRSLKSLRCQDMFEESRKELKELQEKAKSGALDLLYFDETGLSQAPPVPYGWQPKGHTVALPAACNHNARINIIGAVDYCTGDLQSYLFDGRVDSSVVEYVLTAIAKGLTRETVLVLDNATFHTSDEMTDVLQNLEDKYRISFYFIPPYSPELNLVEIVWKRIKYSALQISSYLNFSHLKDTITRILRDYNSANWKVSFA